MPVNFKRIVVFSIYAISFFILGWFSGLTWNDYGSNFLSQPLREKKDNYQWISPLLASGEGNVFTGLPDLETKLSNLIDKYKEENKISAASVYWRDLNMGQWIGIDEDKHFAPASLLKVALLITYLKEAQNNPLILQKTLVYQGLSDPKRRAFNGPTRLVAGETYSVIDLIQQMIIYSDNDAKDLLHQLVAPQKRSEIFNDLGLQPPLLDEKGDIYSPREYSIFFRVLYNSTYLGSDLSEAALGLLGMAEFKEGLVAGLPENIRVAHKFGLRLNPDDPERLTRVQLHDCGIVYYPDHPYFLCVMTKGEQEKDLEMIIKEISKTVYESR